MTAPRLREDYQTGLIEKVRQKLRTHRRTILQSPTGSGKTVLTAHMIRTSASRGLRSFFLVHRKELLDQTSRALSLSDVDHGVIQGGRSGTADLVQVASVQTLVRRLDKLVPPQFVVIDEAHHAAARTYQEILEWCPDAYVVGLTATPVRTDGRGLNDIFNGLVLGPSVRFLTDRGYLAPYRLVAPPSAIDLTGVHTRAGDYAKNELEAVVDQSVIVGNAVEHYKKYVLGRANGRPPTCLIYCVSRAHAHHVEEAYRAAGIDAHYCAGDTPKEERDAIVAGFRLGKPPVIVSVDLFGEGLDVPGLAAVQLLRPTQSLALHLQQIGRALRPEAGKEYALILDHVGNTWRHGLPDDDREWTLEGTRGQKKAPDGTAPPIRLCEDCFLLYRATLPTCPGCGAVPKADPAKMPDEVEGELEEMDPEEHRRRRLRKQEEGRAKGLEALVKLAVQRGYKPGWAAHREAARTGRPVYELLRQENEIRREAR